MYGSVAEMTFASILKQVFSLLQSKNMYNSKFILAFCILDFRLYRIQYIGHFSPNYRGIIACHSLEDAKHFLEHCTVGQTDIRYMKWHREEHILNYEKHKNAITSYRAM